VGDGASNCSFADKSPRSGVVAGLLTLIHGRPGPTPISVELGWEKSMDKDRVRGAVKRVKGSVKEAIGKVTGETKTPKERQTAVPLPASHQG
jgi:hypothetical protein